MSTKLKQRHTTVQRVTVLEDCNNTKQAKQPHKPAESFSVYQTVNTGAALWLTASISVQITHAYHNVQQTACYTRGGAAGGGVAGDGGAWPKLGGSAGELGIQTEQWHMRSFHYTITQLIRILLWQPSFCPTYCGVSAHRGQTNCFTLRQVLVMCVSDRGRCLWHVWRWTVSWQRFRDEERSGRAITNAVTSEHTSCWVLPAAVLNDCTGEDKKNALIISAGSEIFSSVLGTSNNSVQTSLLSKCRIYIWIWGSDI